MENKRNLEEIEGPIYLLFHCFILVVFTHFSVPDGHRYSTVAVHLQTACGFPAWPSLHKTRNLQIDETILKYTALGHVSPEGFLAKSCAMFAP